MFLILNMSLLRKKTNVKLYLTYSIDIRAIKTEDMPPLQGLGKGASIYYKHTVPTGLQNRRLSIHSTPSPLNRFPKTQHIPIMVLEFKRSETVICICEGFVER